MRKQRRAGAQIAGKVLGELAFDLRDRGKQLQVGLRLGTPGDGFLDRACQRRVGGGLLAGAEKHLPAGLVHRHRPFDDGDHRASHARRNREDGPLYRSDRVAGQHAQVPPALLGGPDDDVAALEVKSLAAPGGGDEQLRSLVHVHRRSVGEPQHGVGPRARADRLLLADRGACCESSLRQAIQAAVRGNDRGPRTAGSHHGVDCVASEIKDREKQCGSRGEASPSHQAGGGPGPLRHGDDPSFPLHPGHRGAARGAAAEMVFHQDTAAASELSAQVRAEVRPEFRTAGAGGVRHVVPRARPRGLERCGIDVFLSHLLQCSFQSVFGHRRPPSRSAP